MSIERAYKALENSWKKEERYGADEVEEILEKMSEGRLAMPTPEFMDLVISENSWESLFRWEEGMEKAERVWGEEKALGVMEVDKMQGLVSSLRRDTVVDWEGNDEYSKRVIEGSVKAWEKRWREGLGEKVRQVVQGWEDSYGREWAKRGLVRALLQGRLSDKISSMEMLGWTIKEVLVSDIDSEYKQEVARMIEGKDVWGYFDDWYENTYGREGRVKRVSGRYRKTVWMAVKHAEPYLKAQGVNVEEIKKRMRPGNWERFLASELVDGWSYPLKEKEVVRCLVSLENEVVEENLKVDWKELVEKWYPNRSLVEWAMEDLSDAEMSGSVYDFQSRVSVRVKMWLLAREKGMEVSDEFKKSVEENLSLVKRYGDKRSFLKTWEGAVDGVVGEYLIKHHQGEWNTKARQVIREVLEWSWEQLQSERLSLKLADERENKDLGDAYWGAGYLREGLKGLLRFSSWYGKERSNGWWQKLQDDCEQKIKVAIRRKQDEQLPWLDRVNRKRLFWAYPTSAVLGQALWDLVTVKEKDEVEVVSGRRFKKKSLVFTELPEDKDEAIKIWRKGLEEKLSECLEKKD